MVVWEQLAWQEVLARQEDLMQQMGLSLQGGPGVALAAADYEYDAVRWPAFWDVQSTQYSAVMHTVLRCG